MDHPYQRLLLHFETGDIAQAHAEGLMTLINSSGMWFGGVDSAIQRVAGYAYHQAAETYLRQLDRAPQQGEAICVDGDMFPRSSNFRFVVFVIDDLKMPLHQLVHAGLVEASKWQMTSVSIPLMRTGVMAGVVEKTPAEAIEQMMVGIKQFADGHPNCGMAITIVAYGDSNGSMRQLLLSQAQSVLR